MLVSSMALALFGASTAGANPFAFQPAQNSNNARAKYISKVMAKARRLEENNNNNNNNKNNQDDGNDYMTDLSKFNLVFEKCQFMRYYADECNDEVGTCLNTGSFALFRLCPSCSSCSYNYGEYMVALDDYLQYTTEYFQEKQEEECEYCAANCYYDGDGANQYAYEAAEEEAEGDNQDENHDEGEDEHNQDNNDENKDGEDNKDGEGEDNKEGENEGEGEGEDNKDRRRLNYYGNSAYDCDTCKTNCDKWNNMAANGYVQATQYLGCVKIYEDYYGQAYYSGAMCGNSDGGKVKIGVFKDANCALPTELDIETYVNLAAKNGRKLNNNQNANQNADEVKISHSILKHVYSSGNCIPCGVQDENADAYYEGDQNNNAVLDVCENLYNGAAKCETSHGFDESKYLTYNQQAQEQTVCTLINQLKGGTYDAISGEINLSGKSKKYATSGATGGQKFALTFFILATCGLAVYAAMLHQKLVKGGPGRFASANGSMA